MGLSHRSLSVPYTLSLGNVIDADGARFLAGALMVNHNLEILNLECRGFHVECWNVSVLRERSISVSLCPMHCLLRE